MYFTSNDTYGERIVSTKSGKKNSRNRKIERDKVIAPAVLNQRLLALIFNDVNCAKQLEDWGKETLDYFVIEEKYEHREKYRNGYRKHISSQENFRPLRLATNQVKGFLLFRNLSII